MRFHGFDPYTEEAERAAKARAQEAIERRAQLKSMAFGHTDPDVKRRREVHANQTKRAKIPVTLPKVCWMSDEVREALKGLVDRLDEIHDDPAYKSVWTSYMIHGGRYDGPTYVEELARARAALASVEKPG